MTSVSFFVPGPPQPQGSARAFVVKGRAVVTSDNPKLKSWRNDIAFEAMKDFSAPYTGPVRVAATFVFQRPKSHFFSGKRVGVIRDTAPHAHTNKPDVDKCIRGLLDALTSIAYRDDAQVASVSARKYYATEGSAVGTWIAVEELV